MSQLLRRVDKSLLIQSPPFANFTCELLDLLRPLSHQLARHDDEGRLDRVLPGEVLWGEPLAGDGVGAGIDKPDGDGGLAVAHLKGFGF